MNPVKACRKVAYLNESQRRAYIDATGNVHGIWGNATTAMVN
jgi:hypothetical protein